MSRPLRALLATIFAIGLLSGGTPLADVIPGAATPAVEALTTGGSIRFPGLGRSGNQAVTGTIHNWGCRGGEIGTRIYRWGCAGRGNRYLIAHAHASFEPLHDFVRARGVRAGTRALVGKPVYLRTTTGRVVMFRVTWARVETVGHWGRTGHDWAWNATGVSSITFQTCYGARSEYRLIVRAERVS
jgi:hypothetical protein